MNKRFLFGACLAFFAQIRVCAENENMTPKWLRWCAVSPDGKNIAFSYCGDIFTVPVMGGQARQLTTNTAYEYAPVWSPDSRHIAFASTREGSMDVFVTTIDGGAPERVTTNSGSEIPVAFLDSQHIIYKSVGMRSTEDLVFPSATFSMLYQVGIDGGRPEVYSEWPMDNPSLGKTGVLFEDIKGYEDYWRKHQVSSIARDIWLFDGNDYQKITDFAGDDRSPVWAPDQNGFYYLSERNGSFNVFYHDLKSGEADRQITRHQVHPVRFLSVAADGLLCYGYDGEIYTVREGEEPRKIKIDIVRDDMQREVIRQIRNAGASEVAISPKNKEIAFVLDGDVYVTSTDYTTTKQITDTPERERTIDFSPDGRSLVYASEREGMWQVYQATIAQDKEKNFTYCTGIREERLTNGQYTAFQPLYNPKGGEVAFLKNRTEICVLDLKNKKVRTVMDGKFQYSYTDGDQNYAWSPDGKWILTEYIGIGGWNNKDIALVKADGKGEIHNLTNSGYSEGSPKWVLDGKAMIFQSDRSGYRSHGSWGSERDEFIMFFDQDAYERFRMSKEELALLEEKEKEEKEAREKESDQKKEAKKSKKKRDRQTGNEEQKDSQKSEDQELVFDLENLDDRTIRLTPYSTNLGDAVLSKDGTKLYYVAPHEGGGALWVQHLKEYRNELKMKGMDWARLDVDADVKNAYMASGGYIKKLDIESGRVSTIGFEAFHTERPDAKRACLFEHIWKQTKEKLYDPGMNGADWEGLYQSYKQYLPWINNNYDFAEMASELLGELNVSHTGCRFGGYGGALPTATLGLFYDTEYTGDGLKVKEVLCGGPLDTKKKEVRPGDLIKAIDGQEIKAGMDYFPLLEGKSGRYTRLTVVRNGREKDVIIKPISSGRETDLLYDRWVERNRAMVEKLSQGRLVYVHIKEMNASCFQKLYKELMSDENRNKDAVIVDTRHNGGGWLHDDICILLSGKKTMEFRPRGQFIGNDPFDRWVKPSCMLICEDNYSNAHGTPWYYKEQGLGKLIGAPVPGTMTAVWWEGLDGGLVFGIPQVTTVDPRGEILENQLLKPDVEVYNNPKDVLNGRDLQLERAVEEMLKSID